MKLKKVIGIVIVSLILLAAILMAYPNNTYAANSSYVLGITNIRESGYGYGVGGLKSDKTPTKKVWKIVSYNNNIISYDNAFYCIKAEHGFVDNTNNGNTDVSTIRKTYDTKFDMKTESTSVISRLNAINTAVGDAAISTQTYNKILWIMDNMYLPKAATASVDKQTLLNAAGITNIILTDDQIEAVQQLALWHYTNPNDTNYNTATTIYENRNIRQDSNYAALADIYDDPVAGTQKGRIYQAQADALYNYLVNEANKHPEYLLEDVNTTPVTLNSTDMKAIQEGERIIVGPFNITVNSNRTYNLSELVFKDEAGNTINLTGNNKLLNANKQEVASGNINDVIGQNFYISLPSNTTIKNVSISIKGSYPTTSATYYTTAQSTYIQEQPVVLVERGNKPISLSAQVPLPSPLKIDLALRKFITGINSQGVEKEITNRIPNVDTSTIDLTTGGTATYNHTKQPLAVKIGDIVTYTIRVYNEGKVDGYVSQITDHLPSYLEFIKTENAKTEAEKAAALFNENYLWEVSSDGRTIKTSLTAQDKSDTYSVLTGIERENTLLKAFNGGATLDYIDVKVKCKVKNTATQGIKITNIADITGMQDASGNDVTIDRDSQVGNVQLPTDAELPNYKDDEINSGKTYIPGQQDDDDFEKLVIEIFDLALRKFITAVDNESITTRIPVASIGKDGNIKYTHTKEPVEVQTGNIVTYTLRIYNEGDIAGYAKEITDDLPQGLEYLPANDLNKTYRWKMIDKDGKETQDLTKAVKVTTDYLSKEQEKTTGANLIKAFNKEAGITDSNPDYKDVKIAFKVIEPNTSDKILTNIAQISDDSDENGNDIDDIDSIPGNDNMKEDDIDVEHVKLVYFDLALRKFITKVNNLDINNRYPKLTMDEKGNIKYTHTKEPVEVENGNIVTYTIRVYNEGKMSGYAKEITDDLPQGLEYLPENELNKTYRWKMIDKDGKETQDVKKAAKITTDYLSKEQEKEAGANLIKAFDKTAGITNTNPDYKDVKIAFKVTEPNTSDRILINTAQISDDSDKNGNPVEDIDSTPGNSKPGEDDIDIEKVKVKYFDLALKKWVTQVYTIENGKQTVTNTGHTGDENPEPVVKVDLKDKKLNKVTVKFGYKIKVTNEGQIEGYAKEVKDYIPNGLKFVAEDNPTWKKINDKEVVTDKLANTLLKPGESATVDIILTWENSENNLGLKVNVAEISKDYNESHTPDIDSTPNNKKEGEDDIDDAPVILSIKTGELRVYVVLTTVVLFTLAGGVILIKKYVL